jgi:cellulose biosynthesis protein BcsQ
LDLSPQCDERGKRLTYRSPSRHWVSGLREHLGVGLAAIASRDLSLSVLVVDADENRSALDWITRAGSLIPVDVAPGTPHEVRKLRRASRWDLVIVDLPGAREGAFAAVLGGDGEGPVCDYLLVPSGPEVMDLRPVGARHPY